MGHLINSPEHKAYRLWMRGEGPRPKFIEAPVSERGLHIGIVTARGEEPKVRAVLAKLASRRRVSKILLADPRGAIEREVEAFAIRQRASLSRCAPETLLKVKLDGLLSLHGHVWLLESARAAGVPVWDPLPRKEKSKPKRALREVPWYREVSPLGWSAWQLNGRGSHTMTLDLGDIPIAQIDSMGSCYVTTVRCHLPPAVRRSARVLYLRQAQLWVWRWCTAHLPRIEGQIEHIRSGSAVGPNGPG